jgi:hypothetical protein
VDQTVITLVSRCLEHQFQQLWIGYKNEIEEVY